MWCVMNLIIKDQHASQTGHPGSPCACSILCTRLTLEIGFQCNANTASKDSDRKWCLLIFVYGLCDMLPSCEMLAGPGVWWWCFICGKEQRRPIDSNYPKLWNRPHLKQLLWRTQTKETSGSTATNSWWKWKSVCQSPLVMTKAAWIGFNRANAALLR